VRWLLILFCLESFLCSSASAIFLTDEASSKALEATLISTGAADFKAKLQHFGEERANFYAEKVGIRSILATGLAAHRIVVTKEFSFRVKQNTISLTPNSIRWQIPL